MPLDESALRCLVERFYERIRADEMLSGIFADHVTDWEAHTARLVDFWSSIMLTSGRYKGNPHAAHLPFVDRLTPELFNHWLKLWSETARSSLDEEAARQLEEKAERIARSLQAGLLFRPERCAPTKTSAPLLPGQH
ncbi:group III truncated hemoglobin [Pelagibacterium montanilacus]|uniref:group III truncated hemoglobin n=1 Tax=Pelagibacterium montanilacus TaxID=2185280 RepID=UPI000F8CF6EF|nr:group III truncated hemoglobin [Pelagibacterium montanilacus]